jgi:dTDP-glucose 4,6-dehydratase
MSPIPHPTSKTANDQQLRACHQTYSLTMLTTNCSNNYGLYHFPEMLIPMALATGLILLITCNNLI